MQDPKKLRAWHLAHALAVEVVDALPQGLGRRIPGLRAQAIRAATSVVPNLVEGCGRSSRADFLSFVHTAVGSLNELEGHLLLARDAGALGLEKFDRLCDRIIQLRRMLLSLRRAIERRIAEDAAERAAPSNVFRRDRSRS